MTEYSFTDWATGAIKSKIRELRMLIEDEGDIEAVCDMLREIAAAEAELKERRIR